MRHRASRADERLEVLKRLWTESKVSYQGRSLASFVFAPSAFLYVTDDLTAGRSVATEFLSRLYNQPFDTLLGRLGIMGPAEVCVEKRQRFIDAGVRYLILAPTCGPQEQVEQLEIYAQHILPHLRVSQPFKGEGKDRGESRP